MYSSRRHRERQKGYASGEDCFGAHFRTPLQRSLRKSTWRAVGSGSRRTPCDGGERKRVLSPPSHGVRRLPKGTFAEVSYRAWLSLPIKPKVLPWAVVRSPLRGWRVVWGETSGWRHRLISCGPSGSWGRCQRSRRAAGAGSRRTPCDGGERKRLASPALQRARQ